MNTFKKILVVVDSSLDRHPELERAMKLADQTQASIYIVDVVKDLSFTVRLLSNDYVHIHNLLVKEKQDGVDGLIAHCKKNGLDAQGAVLEGVSSQVAIKTAQAIGADLIIRSSKGPQSLQHGPLGSSAQKLIRSLPCSIWLTQADHEPNCKTIVAAVDATPNDAAHAGLNRRILGTAKQLAAQESCKLLVSYVWNLHGSDMLKHRLPAAEYAHLMEHNRKLHYESLENLLAEFDLHAASPDSRMIEGEPSTAIPSLCASEQADLLICGTVARHGFAGLLLGNTAERIINRTHCSVLAMTPS